MNNCYLATKSRSWGYGDGDNGVKKSGKEMTWKVG